jgi:hypothetical protein
MATKITWDLADFKWNTNPYTWDEVLLAEEVLHVITGTGNIGTSLDNLSPDKKKRFIKLICKVKGTETYSGQKTIRDDIKVEAKDIELVIKEVLGIGLTVENIHV